MFDVTNLIHLNVHMNITWIDNNGPIVSTMT